MGKRLSIILVLLAAVIGLFFSCEQATEEVAVSSVTISQPTAEMIVGETITLKAMVSPSNATDQEVTWASSKQSVATVDKSGLVTAVASGDATITATAGGKRDQCTIVVKEPVVLEVKCVTGEATDIESTSAKLSGTVTIANAKDANGTACFYYSTKIRDAASLKIDGTKIDAGSVSNKGDSFTATITDLTPETEYFFVAAVSIDNQEFLGEVKHFTSKEKPKELSVTGAATDITAFSARLSGYANLTAEMGTVTMGILYSTDENPNLDNGIVVSSVELDANNMYTIQAKELLPCTSYYYKAFVMYGGVYRYGETKTFTTTDFAIDDYISLSTQNCRLDKSNTYIRAYLEGQISIKDGFENLPVSVGFYYSSKDSTAVELIDSGTFVSASNNNHSNVYSASADNLLSDTKYFYIMVVSLYEKKAVGSVDSFISPEILGDAKITVTPNSIIIPSSGEISETIKLLATRDWGVYYKSDWITLDINNGKASSKEQQISISASANKGYDRVGEVVFTIGLAKASLTVKQEGEAGELKKGSGTLEDPFSVAGAIEFCQSLGADVQSDKSVYIKGIVSSVTTTYEASGTYGNAVFYMVDNEGDTDQFYAYQTLYLGNRKWTKGDTDIKAGDAVIICGPVVNFKGNTPETVSKGASYLYSLNGVTEGTAEPEEPTKVEQITCAEFIEKADPNTTYRLVGKVTSSVNATYCSFDMNDGTATVVVWTVNNKDEWKDKVKQGGTVTVRGKYIKYEHNGNVKHEMVDAYIEKFEEGATVDYDNAPAKTIAEFITAADKTTYYKLTGVVSNFYPSYCSMDITDASGTINVYSVANKADWASKISNGGTVVLAGQYDYYAAKTQHEVVNAYILSFTEGQSSGTHANPFNADEAVAYVKANGDKESTDDVYVKGKISSIKNTFDSNYGTAIFNISDDGSATATQFTAYNVYYLGNKAWKDGDSQIKVGDEVVLCGKVTCYRGTYETPSKKAYVYSINGKTSIEQSAAFGVEKTEITVGAAATSATINVTGNVKWTATSEKATVSPASGEGKGAITVSFDANTDTENAKTYTVVVSTTEEVATKSYTVTITQGKASAAGATAYTLDGDAIKAAHTEAWSYTSGEKKVTATDGSEWILFNTYASKNQVTVQMNKGKSAYVLTPALPDGMEIKKIAVVLNTNNSGTGNMGDRPMDVLSADGKTTILDNVTGQTLADGLDVAAGNTQVRIICDETNGGAVFITSITVTYGAK